LPYEGGKGHEWPVEVFFTVWGRELGLSQLADEEIDVRFEEDNLLGSR
jgi:hypothetical protein